MRFFTALIPAILLFLSQHLCAETTLQVLLPLGRTAYQTNELIDLSVVRSSPAELPAADVSITLAGGDGSQVALAFPVKAVAVQNGSAQTTDHFHINGWLLRPGHYAIDVAAYGAKAQTAID